MTDPDSGTYKTTRLLNRRVIDMVASGTPDATSGLLSRGRARGRRPTVCGVGLRPGGAWRFVSTGPAGAEMELGAGEGYDCLASLLTTLIHERRHP
ncbi:hypothetical protein ACIBKY_09265 [Nonomuraea sp. NPDC050394]|uniref:hypothetical protein n=1 Tax=Nonomuraea sp. NPDC050394 TaxID=3364363 RepID=UPI00378C91A0